MRLLKKKMAWVLGIVLGVPLFGAGAIVVSAWLVHDAASRRIYEDLTQLPANDVGLVLGTSKSSGGGRYPNPHFYNRIDAAAEVYRAGRVKHLLLSGDNGTRGYDEPADMRAALLARGVPDAAMTLDDAGFRTLDSIVRAKQVFGQQRLTIITDRFHAFRAVFLARHYGLDAIAYPSANVEVRYSLKSRLRECLADVKACLDLYVLHTQPRFLGPRIEVKVAAR